MFYYYSSLDHNMICLRHDLISVISAWPGTVNLRVRQSVQVPATKSFLSELPLVKSVLSTMRGVFSRRYLELVATLLTHTLNHFFGVAAPDVYCAITRFSSITSKQQARRCRRSTRLVTHISMPRISGDSNAHQTRTRRWARAKPLPAPRAHCTTRAQSEQPPPALRHSRACKGFCSTTTRRRRVR